MVAPTFIQTIFATAFSNTVTATLPAAPTPGNLLVMFGKAGGEFIPPPGFIVIQENYPGVGAYQNFWLGYRVVQPGDPAAWTATQGSIRQIDLMLFEYHGLGPNPSLENMAAILDHDPSTNPILSNVLDPLTGGTPHIILTIIAGNNTLGAIAAPFVERSSDSGGMHIGLADVLTDGAIQAYQASWAIGTGGGYLTGGPYSLVGAPNPPARGGDYPPHHWTG